MRKLLISILIAVIIVAPIAGTYAFVRQGEFDSNAWSSELTFTENDCLSLEMKSDNYKIIQITDLHFAWAMSYNNNMTYDWLDTIIKDEMPDLIIVTGDLVISLFNKAMLIQFAEFMEQREQQWSYVLGNHDIQFGCGGYRYLSVLDDYEYCLFDVGYTNLGYGNQFMVLKNTDNEVIRTFTLLDTHNYVTTKLQAQWYRWGIEGLNRLYGQKDNMMFLHIPFQIQREHIKNTIEKISSLKSEPFMYDYIKELGATKHIVHGHDHLNDYIVEIDGITFVNCLSTGFSGYGKTDVPRGFNIFNISENSVDILKKTQYDYGIPTQKI